MSIPDGWESKTQDGIHHLCWPAPGGGGEPLLLVHGFSAHAHWWDEFAPLLRAQLQDAGVAVGEVLAIDLSGHGDSHHLPAYTHEGWGEEVRALLQAYAGQGKGMVVAHSMGGRGAIWAAVHHPELVSRIVLMDSIVVADAERVASFATSTMVRRERVFASQEEAAAAFRLIPPQPCANRQMLAHIAEHSFRPAQDGEGWVWKSDGAIAAKLPWTDPRDELGGMQVPLWLVRAALSRNCDQAYAESLRWWAPSMRGDLVVPDAHHHLFLDQPLGTAQAVAKALAEPLDAAGGG